MNIPICVLTCDQYLWMLRPFALLFNVFWGHQQEVWIYGYKPDREILDDLPPNFRFISLDEKQYPVEQWSDGLIRMICVLDQPWFILFLEDYWLTTPVKLDVVDELCRYVKQDERILRMDLTTERISKKNSRIIEIVNEVGIVNAPLPTKYSMSFQVGIWNSELALHILRSGETPWQSEIEGTKRVNSLKDVIRVYGSNKKPVEYQPVYRNHKHSLTFDKIPVHLINVMKQSGWLDR